MKLFIDSANVNEIKKVKELGILGGITTNPTLLAKEIKDPKNQEEILDKICKAGAVDVFAEPISTDYHGIVKESIELSRISKHIVAKIPITIDGVKAAAYLKEKGIRTALTLLFSTEQAIVAAAAGADFICPFVGRLDDSGKSGIGLVSDICQVYKNCSFSTKIVVVSVRNEEHVFQSAKLGVYGVSVPLKVLNSLFKHELTDAGIEKFLKDWNSIMNV